MVVSVRSIQSHIRGRPVYWYMENNVNVAVCASDVVIFRHPWIGHVVPDSQNIVYGSVY